MKDRFFDDEKAPSERGFFHVRPSLWLIGFVLAGLGLCIWLGSRTVHHAAPEVVQTQVVSFVPKLIGHVVKPGDTFAGILALYGVPPDKSNKLYSSLMSTGFSCLFPGDSLVLAMTEEGSLLECNILSGLSYWYRMKIGGQGINAEKTKLPITVQQCVIWGELSSSLSEALNALGVGDAVVSQFADIFAWDINFFMDPQRGDRFRVVVERLYAGDRFVGYGTILAASYCNQGKTFTAFGVTDTTGKIRYYDESGKSLEKEFLKAPLRYNRISSLFTLHRKHPVLGIVRPHLGIDYAAPTGTPVYAAADGLVVFSGVKGGFGRYIVIRHGAAYETSYGHLNSIAKGVGAGKRVIQGSCIGAVGSSGLSTGPHLDYRMQKNGHFVNPLTISAPSKEGIDVAHSAVFSVTRDQWLDVFNLRYGAEPGCYLFNVYTQVASCK